jgi:hypothetical protein
LAIAADLKDSVDNQMVDLGTAAVELDPEIVDRCVVPAIAVSSLNLIGGIPLASSTGTNRADLLLDIPARPRAEATARQEGRERVDFGLPIFGRFDQHRATASASPALIGRRTCGDNVRLESATAWPSKPFLAATRRAT